MVEIGRRLVRCRELLKTQRGWLAWIKTKFGWSRATADNMIAVYVHRDELLKFSTLRLPISALYLLAKQEPEVLQRIERHVDAGEPVTARAVKVIVTQWIGFLYNLRPGTARADGVPATIVRPTTTQFAR